jgi:uncharacterized protein (TIGR00255 family)
MLEIGDKMIISMTGFGQCRRETDNFSVIIELRSVNHRFFDCHIRMPQQMIVLEEKIKKYIRQSISRGRIDCFITIEGTNLSNKHLNIDWNLIDEYYQFIESLKERYRINETIQITHFLNNHQLVTVYEKDELTGEVEQLILDAVEVAVKQLIEMREIEGREVEKELTSYLATIENELHMIESYIPLVIKQYEDRIYAKLKDMTTGLINEDRITTEVAILAERSDITEEISRLKSHVLQFRYSLAEDLPVGRKLDFILQEMNREVNTIGSKSSDANISSKVVLLKSIIEKMKEQVQNIE